MGRVLVTGASGLLGINLALEAAKSHTVFGLVNHQHLQTEAFSVIQADILKPGALERVLDQTQPDWVIHCAAMAIIDHCEADPNRARQLNKEIPARMASHLYENVTRGGARLVHISTDAVFDGQTGNYSEEDPPHPLSVYAQTKLDGELAVATANPEAIIARVNLFGWSVNGSRALSEFFYNHLKAGKTVKGFTDVFFCPLLANDLAYLLLEMLSKGLKGLYHVVSPECITKYEFALRLARQFGFDEKLIFPVSVAEGGLLASRSPNLSLRTDKLFQALGKQPPGLDEALERYYQLYQQGYPQMLKGLGLQGL